VAAGSVGVGHHAGGSSPSTGLSFIRFRLASAGEVVGHHAGGSSPSTGLSCSASSSCGPALVELWAWRFDHSRITFDRMFYRLVLVR
jgi:hypothetical protein